MFAGTPAPRVAPSDPHGAGGRSYARRKPEQSVLYQIVQQELATFLAGASARELRAFLRCGILAYGFVRVHCDGCGLDRVVAFSCKGRGFCPSCGGRRMADPAAHLVDRVLPEVPVRQWVLSLPFALRYRLAYDAPLVRDVLDVFVRSVFTEEGAGRQVIFCQVVWLFGPFLLTRQDNLTKNNLTPGT